MKSLTQLFSEIINKRGVYKQLEESSENIRRLRYANKEGEVSVKTMREICTKAGYKCVQEEMWAKQK